MTKPKQNKSGTWTVRVYTHTDEKGTVHSKKFTAKKRADAIAAARAFEVEKERLTRNDITVAEAVSQYISSREKTLSPSTVRSYRINEKNHFGGIGAIRVNNLDPDTIQEWISELSEELSPKTVRNVFGLFRSAVLAVRPLLVLNVKLPSRERPDLYTPTNEDIMTLLQHSEGDLHLAIGLAAFATLRRGEICALQRSDLKGNLLTVRAAVVVDQYGLLVEKSPKTYGSYRTIPLPASLVAEIEQKEGKLIDMSPSILSDSFARLVERLDLPHIRFHDLRHYSASMMHAAGIPDQYIMQRGGWSTDSVMKRVYINAMDDQTRIMNDRINTMFENVTCPITCPKDLKP